MTNYTPINIEPGVNKEVTRYAARGTWYDTDKVRFRNGFPEKIGGWERVSSNTYQGVCRSLWNWVTLGGNNLLGVGTNLKFYVERGGSYADITPIRETQALTDPFTTVNGSSTVTVDDTAHGALDGDFVTFSGASAVGGLTIDGEYQITFVDADSYTIDAGSNATSNATGGGSVTADYQLNTGNTIATSIAGYGAGYYGYGPYGTGSTTSAPIHLWSQGNFGEDLVFAYRGGPLCYWDVSAGLSTRAELATALSGASDVPTVVNYVFVSDIRRFTIAFGVNTIGTSVLDPMLVRWCDQEDAANWTPAATNQAGSLRLSRGSEIVCAVQSKQEIVVFTDTAVYSMQYLGAPDVWGAQLLDGAISIASQNAAVYVADTAFWMGNDRFYIYDGRVQPLPCSLRRYVFNDINIAQLEQCFAGINEGFNEVWWFYCSENSTTVDRYVVYNYVDNLWFHGSLARTAWLDFGLRKGPVAATYSNNLVTHEMGWDDNETGTTQAIEAHATTAEFDIDDSRRNMLIRKVIPDVTFTDSTAASPSITMEFNPLAYSGAGYKDPKSEGGNSSASVTRTSAAVIEEYTEKVNIRVRGKQMSIKYSSTGEGVAWQLGTMRFDMRASGRR